MEEITKGSRKDNKIYVQKGNKKNWPHKNKRAHLRNPESAIIDQEDEETAAASVGMELRRNKALHKFRSMVEGAILDNYLLERPKKPLSRNEIQMAREKHRDIRLWGVPLLPSEGLGATDTVLLKFLTAKDFKVHDAFKMLRKTLKWRKEFKTDTILEENLHPDLEKFVHNIDSIDKQGRPLYYIFYGHFKDKELYKKILGTEENREKFLRLRIQFLERSIKQLNFKAGGADSVLQITDLKNSPGPEMKELRLVSEKTSMLLQANYPEIIQKHIVLNVPFWYYTSHVLTSKLQGQRSRPKVILVRPSQVTKKLLKYISAENLPVEYGGLKRENDVDFSPEDKASELVVQPNSVSCIKITIAEVGVTMLWDVTVVGWDVGYKEEFIPEDEGSYKVLLRNDDRQEKRVGYQSVRNSFYINEPGKMVFTIDNETPKTKRVYYRSKAKPTPPIKIHLKK